MQLYKWLSSGLRGYQVAIVHGGWATTYATQGRVRTVLSSMRSYDEVWVTNSEMQRAFAAVEGLPPLTVVSPFVSEHATWGKSVSPSSSGRAYSSTTLMSPGRRLRLAILALGAKRVYNLELAIELVERLQAAGRDVQLDVVIYGRVASNRRAIVEKARSLAGITVYCDLDAEEVRGILRTSDVFLRPTLTDGDSLAVREALNEDCIVIASDTVPRPAGVLLAEPSVKAFQAALDGSARVSDGSGTGIPILKAVALRRMALRETETRSEQF